jgi:hypothetical protein
MSVSVSAYLDLHGRVDEALAVLDKVDRLPGAGTHWPDCHLQGHSDCLAVRLTQILGGGR